MFKRLAAYIFVIVVSRTYGQFQLSFGTPTPQAPLIYDPNCKDTLTNCWDFPISSCQAPYIQWATTNCPNRCGICLGPTTAAPPCVNALSNCESYDKSICTNPDYKNWATKNCRFFCEFCPPGEIARLKAMTTTISPANCVDKVDCRLYGPDACDGLYKAWAKDNCPRHCNFCAGLPTAPPVCVDKIPNCKLYDPDTCTNPMYNLWVDDNCKQFCGRCSGGPTVTYNVPPSPPPPGKERLAEKRQFHASHHHHYKCWDAGNDVYITDNLNCSTASPSDISTARMSGDSSTPDFPGSEYGPNHKSPDNWDSKPSTDAPSTTTKSTKPADKTTKSPETNSTDLVPPTITAINATKHAVGSTEKTTNISQGGNNSTSTITPGPNVSGMSTTDTATPARGSNSTLVSTSPNTSGVTQNPNPQNTGISTMSTSKTPPVMLSTTSMGIPPKVNGTSPTDQSAQTAVSAQVHTQGPNLINTTAAIPPTLAPVSSSETNTPTPTTISTTTTQSTTPTTTPEPCFDTIPNCQQYGIQNCNVSVYRPYMMSHCEAFCNFCTDYSKCKNKINNCAEFDSGNLCTSDAYSTWAYENCYLYCGYYPCAGDTTTMVTTTTTTVKLSTTSSIFNCTDLLDNCVYYDDDKCIGIYSAWARKNCAKRCGYCNDYLPCIDTNPDCDKYPQTICVAAEFRGWARDNCRKFCGLCTKPTESMSTQQTGHTDKPVTGPTGTPPTPATPVKSAEPTMSTTQSR